MAPRRPDLSESAPAPRSWSSRLAWGVLVTAAAGVVARVFLATVVQVHGDGMAPTLLDGDYVLLLRGDWSVDRGDVVVYGAPAGALAASPTPAEHDVPPSPNDDGHEFPDIRAPADRDLRNTAVVDADELGEALQENWRRVQTRSEAGLLTTASYRVGRVLAVPGDRVRLVPNAGGLGLEIQGEPIVQKDGGALRIRLREHGNGDPQTRPIAWETSGHRRWAVLAQRGVQSWRALGLGGVELVAPGYLVLADNRAEGACCDSRALGWIASGALRGEVVVRLAGDPSATPDLDPAARGFRWKP